MTSLWKKLVNRETVSYFVFGVLTTLVDWVSYWVMTRLGQIDYRVATAGSWAAAVLFAFVTNKLFVFQSRSLHPRKVWSEFVPFVACRAATGLFTLVAMVVISLVLNYIFSKWVIFRKTS